MNKNVGKQVRRARRRIGIRKRIIGTPERPRLSVYKSLNHMYAQIINDLDGRTLAAASTMDKSIKTEKTGNIAAAAAVGVVLMHFVFRMNVLAIMGGLCACFTNPAALAAASKRTDTDLPALAYASIYPVALIVKIVLAQILVALGP